MAKLHDALQLRSLVPSMCFIAIGALIALSILGYHASDPSFNYSTNIVPHNPLGTFGAYISDFLLQSLGLATLILCIVPLVLGVRIFLKARVRFVWIRLIVFTLIATLSFSLLLSYIPSSEHWMFMGFIFIFHESGNLSLG